VIGLVIGLILGIAGNCLQKPDLGGGWVQKAVGGIVGVVDRSLLKSEANEPEGAARGRAVAFVVSVAEPIGKLFLRLMQMMVLPLVFSALYLAVVDVGDLRKLGRIGLVTLFYTGILSISAVLIGVTLVNVVQPGKTISDEVRTTLTEKYAAKATEGVAKADAAKTLGQTLVDLLPENPVQEMVGAVDGSSKGNGMLAVMFFADGHIDVRHAGYVRNLHDGHWLGAEAGSFGGRLSCVCGLHANGNGCAVGSGGFCRSCDRGPGNSSRHRLLHRSASVWSSIPGGVLSQHF
jgi:Na+/H+-dicarboxylate symporter